MSSIQRIIELALALVLIVALVAIFLGLGCLASSFIELEWVDYFSWKSARGLLILLVSLSFGDN